MGWTYLVFAGLFEIGFTTSLKLSDGFTRLWPSLAFLVTSGLSFFLLNKSIQTLPLGTAYAVWTGIGAVGTAAIGMVFFKDPVSLSRVFFLFLIIASIIGLRLVSSHSEAL